MATIEDLARQFRGRMQNQIEGIRGTLGRLNDDDTVTVRVPGSTNRVFVRLAGDEANTIEAINIRTDIRAHLPVLLRLNASKQYEVLGVDPLLGDIFLGEAAGAANYPPAAVPPRILIPSDQFLPGRCRALNGDDLQVYIESFVSDGAVLGATTIDLSSVSLAAGTHAWVVISLDPATNEPTATKADEHGILYKPLTHAEAAAVTIPTGEIRLFAYDIADGDTALPTAAEKIVDLRDFLRAPVASGGDMSSFDVHGDAGVFTVTDAETFYISGGAGLATTAGYTGPTPVVSVALALDELTEETVVDEDNDYFVIYSDSNSAERKVKGANIPGGSGTFVPAGTQWQPFACPASPSAQDDEFADVSGGLPNSWTEYDHGSDTTENEADYGLMINKTSTASSTLGGIYKALPAGDFSIWTHVSLAIPAAGGVVGSGKAIYAGIGLYEDASTTGGDAFLFGLAVSNATTFIYLLSFSAYNTIVGSLIGLTTGVNPNAEALSMFLRVRRTSGNYIWEFSHDGRDVIRAGTDAPGFTPAHMGLCVNNLNTGLVIPAVFSFFRYAGSDVGNVPMAGQRIKYYAA